MTCTIGVIFLAYLATGLPTGATGAVDTAEVFAHAYREDQGTCRKHQKSVVGALRPVYFYENGLTYLSIDKFCLPCLAYTSDDRRWPISIRHQAYQYKSLIRLMRRHKRYNPSAYSENPRARVYLTLPRIPLAEQPKVNLLKASSNAQSTPCHVRGVAPLGGMLFVKRKC